MKEVINQFQLSVDDRMVIVTCLPRTGHYEDLIINKDIKAKIDLSQDEIKEFEVVTKRIGNESLMSWNEKGVKSIKSITFTQIEMIKIADVMKQRDKEGTLADTEIKVYEMFVK